MYWNEFGNKEESIYGEQNLQWVTSAVEFRIKFFLWLSLHETSHIGSLINFLTVAACLAKCNLVI